MKNQHALALVAGFAALAVFWMAQSGPDGSGKLEKTPTLPSEASNGERSGSEAPAPTQTAPPLPTNNRSIDEAEWRAATGPTVVDDGATDVSIKNLLLGVEHPVSEAELVALLSLSTQGATTAAEFTLLSGEAAKMTSYPFANDENVATVHLTSLGMPHVVGVCVESERETVFYTWQEGHFAEVAPALSTEVPGAATDGGVMRQVLDWFTSFLK